jgi:hypothetical protein
MVNLSVSDIHIVFFEILQSYLRIYRDYKVMIKRKAEPPFNELNEFLGEYLYSIIDDDAVDRLPEKWKGPSGVLEVSIRGERFQAIGNYSKKDPFKLLSSKSLSDSEGFLIKYTGKICGRTTESTLTIRSKGTGPSLIARRKARILISKNRKEMTVWMGAHNVLTATTHKLNSQ